MPVPLNYPEPQYPEYQQLAAEAKARARRNPYVDPSNLEPESGAVSRRGGGWARAVLGFTYRGASSIALWHQQLLLLADEQDITPPLPGQLVQAREEQARHRAENAAAHQEWLAALDAEWDALRAALPFPVAVAHNYKSGRHCENGYVQGADHLIAQEAFTHGRMARLRHQALCATRSNRHNLDIAYPEGEKDGSSNRPTCKRCIRIACKIAAKQAPTMLSAPHANGGGGIPNRVWKARTKRGRRWAQ